MLQGNRADIGMFEALQADQHAKTGISQMAVFNDLNAVKNTIVRYNQLLDKAAEANKVFETREHDILWEAQEKREKATRAVWDNNRDAGRQKNTAEEAKQHGAINRERDALIRAEEIRRQGVAKDAFQFRISTLTQTIEAEKQRIRALQDKSQRENDKKTLKQAINKIKEVTGEGVIARASLRKEVHVMP
jgi:hypothetical protein